MRRRDGGGLTRPGLGEPFGGELADGLQQPVAQRCPGWFRHDQALVHQRAEQAGDVDCRDSAEPHTASAASRSKPSANTDRRPSSTRSAPVSSE